MDNIEDYEITTCEISGLYIVKNLKLNSDNIIEKLDKLQWVPLSSSKNSRMVQHYGYKYNYSTYNIKEKCEPLPNDLEFLPDILTNICKKIFVKTDKFNQCIINNYNVGQGICKHIDVKSYGSVIGCFTIGSGSSMIFRNGSINHEIYIEPNSLYIMSGDARYLYTHEMPSRKTDTINGKSIKRSRRISLTFRNVKE